MITINDLSNNISYDNIKLSAINIIQNKIKEYFVRKYGVNWKDVINYEWTVEDLDYYCERKGIMDPWYDYCDDPRYDYKVNK
jgi:hypothetical protein